MFDYPTTKEDVVRELVEVAMYSMSMKEIMILAEQAYLSELLEKSDEELLRLYTDFINDPIR